MPPKQVPKTTQKGRKFGNVFGRLFLLLLFIVVVVVLIIIIIFIIYCFLLLFIIYWLFFVAVFEGHKIPPTPPASQFHVGRPPQGPKRFPAGDDAGQLHRGGQQRDQRERPGAGPGYLSAGLTDFPGG